MNTSTQLNQPIKTFLQIQKEMEGAGKPYIYGMLFHKYAIRVNNIPTKEPFVLNTEDVITNVNCPYYTCMISPADFRYYDNPVAAVHGLDRPPLMKIKIAFFSSHQVREAELLGLKENVRISHTPEIHDGMDEFVLGLKVVTPVSERTLFWGVERGLQLTNDSNGKEGVENYVVHGIFGQTIYTIKG